MLYCRHKSKGILHPRSLFVNISRVCKHFITLLYCVTNQIRETPPKNQAQLFPLLGSASLQSPAILCTTIILHPKLHHSRHSQGLFRFSIPIRLFIYLPLLPPPPLIPVFRCHSVENPILISSKPIKIKKYIARGLCYSSLVPLSMIRYIPRGLNR